MPARLRSKVTKKAFPPWNSEPAVSRMVRGACGKAVMMMAPITVPLSFTRGRLEKTAHRLVYNEDGLKAPKVLLVVDISLMSGLPERSRSFHSGFEVLIIFPDGEITKTPSTLASLV